MDVVYIALIILTVIYLPFWFIVKFGDKIGPLKKTAEKLHSKGLTTYLFIAIMVRTKWGISLINKLGKYKRFWRACGVMSWFVTLFLMIYIVAILVIDVIYLPQAMGQSGMGIEYALMIPGLNPAVPLVYGWIALIIAMVVHELAHGFQTKANDMTVKSTGILYGVVPLGAFVEPDEEQVEKSSRRAKMDLYAAGITTNFILGMIMFILMFSLTANCITCEYGDNPAVYGVSSDSPAYESDIPSTAIIIEVNGTTITSVDDFYKCVPEAGNYTITYKYHNDTETKNLRIGTYVESVVSNSPASSCGIQKGDILESITINGVTKTFGSNSQFSDYMKNTKPGDIAEIVVWRGNEHPTLTTTLSNNSGVGYLGISTTTSGFQFTTPNITLSYGTNPFYGCETLQEYSLGILSFISKAFNGYSPVPESTQWWYETSFDSNVFWVIVQLFYWIFWVNMALGVTNALPAVPFDGGFLFIGGVNFILEKCGMRDAEKRDFVTRKISNFVTLLSLMILVLVMVVIVF